jgi:hypothetical protein
VLRSPSIWPIPPPETAPTTLLPRLPAICAKGRRYGYPYGHAAAFPRSGTNETILRPDQIIRFLRMITSSECRGRPPLGGRRHVRVVAQDVVSGALDRQGVGDLCTVLTPIIRAVERGEFKFRRTGPRSGERLADGTRCNPTHGRRHVPDKSRAIPTLAALSLHSGAGGIAHLGRALTSPYRPCKNSRELQFVDKIALVSRAKSQQAVRLSAVVHVLYGQWPDPIRSPIEARWGGAPFPILA